MSAEPRIDTRIGIVAIAGSAGGSSALREILARLPADFPVPIVYVQHLAQGRSVLVDVLQYSAALRVRWAEHGDSLRPGNVYVAPPGFACTVTPDATLELERLASTNAVLRIADALFASVADAYQDRAVAIVLSGAGQDGSEGVSAVYARAGTVLAQDETTSLASGMTTSAIETGLVDLVVSPLAIGPLLVQLARDRGAIATVRPGALESLEEPLLAKPEWNRALWHVLDTALALHDAPFGNLQLFDPESRELRIVVQRGFDLEFLTHFRKVCAADDSACGRALRERWPVTIADVHTDPCFASHREIAAASGFRAVQSLPLITRGGRIIGVLSTHFRRPLPGGTDVVLYSELHARRAAAAIERLGIA